MSITVKDKEYWKERLAKKIEHAITSLLEERDPTFMERIAKEAKAVAVEKLGRTKEVAEMKRIETDIAKLEEELVPLKAQLSATAEHAKVAEDSSYYRELSRWNAAVSYLQVEEEKKLLAATTLGQHVLRLQREQESLLDTIWLSTSTNQVRDLWQNVLNMLAEEPTELQQKALVKPITAEDDK